MADMRKRSFSIKKRLLLCRCLSLLRSLGDLYAISGNQAEAEKQYALVKYIGLLGHINQVLHNRDLALFDADHDRNLGRRLSTLRKRNLKYGTTSTRGMRWRGSLQERQDGGGSETQARKP